MTSRFGDYGNPYTLFVAAPPNTRPSWLATSSELSCDSGTMLRLSGTTSEGHTAAAGDDIEVVYESGGRPAQLPRG